jgi:hypothetical protein
MGKNVSRAAWLERLYILEVPRDLRWHLDVDLLEL